jgi:hypothetical protein
VDKQGKHKYTQKKAKNTQNKQEKLEQSLSAFWEERK